MDAKTRFEKEQFYAEYDGEDRVVSSKEFVEEQERMGSMNVPTISSGLPKFDALIGGFQGGELITVTGPTGNGKTSFCHTLTKNFAKAGVLSLWLSFEVGNMQLIQQFSTTDLFYLPRRIEKRNIQWVVDKAIEAKTRFNIGAMFVDTLDEVVSMEKARGNLSVETGVVVSELKSLAIDLNIPVFQLTHLTKTRYDTMPTEADIRDSSFVSQKSDKVIMVWRERSKSKLSSGEMDYKFSGNTLVSVDKDRRTGVSRQRVRLSFENKEFKETDSDYDVAMKKATGDDRMPEF